MKRLVAACVEGGGLDWLTVTLYSPTYVILVPKSVGYATLVVNVDGTEFTVVVVV